METTVKKEAIIYNEYIYKSMANLLALDSAFEICYTAFLILDSGAPLPKEVKEILEETKKENRRIKKVNYESLKERLRPFFNQLEVLHQEEIKKKEKELNEKKMSVNDKTNETTEERCRLRNSQI